MERFHILGDLPSKSNADTANPRKPQIVGTLMDHRIWARLIEHFHHKFKIPEDQECSYFTPFSDYFII